MVPSAFVLLPALPVTPSGKVDRRALPHPKDLVQESSAAYEAPQTELECIIANIWKEVLYTNKVGLYDNFFDLGGYSLLLIRVHHELQKSFNREIALIDLFTYPTISSLAQSLSQKADGQIGLDDVQNRTKMRKDAAKRQQHLRHSHRFQS